MPEVASVVLDITHSEPLPKAKPDTLTASLSQVFSSLPAMSISQTCSLPFIVGQGKSTDLASGDVKCCWPIQRPCGEDASALGQGAGALNSLVVLAMRLASFLLGGPFSAASD